MNSKQNQNLSKFIKIALLASMAVVLMYFDFPIPFLPFPWLKIDLSDIPALIGGFALGPLSAVAIELLKNILILVVKGTDSAFVGQIANFAIGACMVMPVAFMHKYKKGFKSTIIGMLIGFIAVEILGILANVYIFLPLYGIRYATEELIKYITIGLIPFNGIKTIMVYGITYMLYKKLGRVLFKDKI